MLDESKQEAKVKASVHDANEGSVTTYLNDSSSPLSSAPSGSSLCQQDSFEDSSISQVEATTLRLFRPCSTDSSMPMSQQKQRIRDLADDCVVAMQDKVHTPNVTDREIQQRFLDSSVPQQPMAVHDYIESISSSFIKDSTQVACPRQIGHMTCSLPQYLPPLADLVTAMHQNTVKAETAKTVSLLEQQVMASLHNLIYQRDTKFYDDALQNTEVALGMFTSGGTIANITGLWVARNSALGPDPTNGFEGVEQCGLLAAALHYGYRGAVIIGSSLMHYSMKKAADLLGIGVQGLLTVGYDEQYRVIIDELEAKLEECRANRICVLAIVGIAGATETGSIDDLAALSDLAQKYSTWFHVDAAWGGPCLFSSKLAPLMDGISRADSVTIDGHKQFYTPMGCGMLVLKDPETCKLVSKTAKYIIRVGSADQGKFTLEGSRPAIAVYMHANLCCIGAHGYEALMNRGARVCSYMADQLRSSTQFEVLLEPTTNILLYRYVPEELRSRLSQAVGSPTMSEDDWAKLDGANIKLQETQKADGLTFVSRTTVFDFTHGRNLVALRVVIGNPLVDESAIDEVIADQLRILASSEESSEDRDHEEIRRY